MCVRRGIKAPEPQDVRGSVFGPRGRERALWADGVLRLGLAVVEFQLSVLDDNANHPGHIFNLGHGVDPTTDPTVLEDVVAFVHEKTRIEES